MSIPIGYSANDFYYMDTGDNGVCKGYNGTSTSNTQCDQNKTTSTLLQTSRNELTTTQDKYNDTMMLYNRELVVTVNMIFGVCMLIYYIYVNKDVLPTIPKSISDIKMPDIKMPEIPKAFPVMSVVK